MFVIDLRYIYGGLKFLESFLCSLVFFYIMGFVFLVQELEINLLIFVQLRYIFVYDFSCYQLYLLFQVVRKEDGFFSEICVFVVYFVC